MLFDMSTDLRTALRAEAVKTADQFYEVAMRLLSAQFAEFLGSASGSVSAPAPSAPAPTSISPPSSKKRSRLSSAEIEKALALVLELLSRRPKGLRLEGMKAELELGAATLKRAIDLGRREGRIQKTGDRRTTTYLLAPAPSAAQQAGRVVRRKK